MNTNRDLLKRLLHLYPLQTIKKTYNLTGNFDDVIENITGSRTGGAITSGKVIQ